MGELTIIGMRVVHEVARHGSFTGAATALGYTQPAVSRQVAAMETASGTALFDRLPRGVRPTAAGEVMVRRAQRVLHEVDGAAQEVAGVRDRLAGRLVVSAFPTAAAVLAPRAVARLTTRHPGLTVELHELGSPVQIRLLRAGRVEVALVATGEGLPEQDLDGLRRETVHVPRGPGIAVAATHRLSGRTEIEVDELAEEIWVVGAGGADQPQFGPWPGLANPRLGPSARTWTTRLGLVAAGLGVSVVPGFAAETVPRDVRWIPVRDPRALPDRRMSVLTQLTPSRGARAAARALRDTAAALGPVAGGTVEG